MLAEKFLCTKDLGVSDYRLYDCRQEPFALHGFFDPCGQACFKRIPDEVAEATSEKIRGLYRHTAGGRVRFRTDAGFLILKAVMPQISNMDIMPRSGSSGFDVYLRKGTSYVYLRSCFPTAGDVGGFEQYVPLPSGDKDVLIHFPLYNDVRQLFLGFAPDATVSAPPPYTFEKPVIFYGSSITQGAAASRPGNSYCAMISRRLDCDFINLGFSGACRAELPMMRYLAGLDCSVFVLDYDHNAPSADYLGATHERAYRILRAAHPELPIILVSRPDFDNWGDESVMQREIIYRTYANAREAGDRNVAFIDGEGLFEGSQRDCCTVDGCHPTDLGFERMAGRIGEVVSRMLKIS